MAGRIHKIFYGIYTESTAKTLGADDKTSLICLSVPCFLIIKTRRFGESIMVNFPPYWKSYYKLYIQLSWFLSASVCHLLRKFCKSNCLSNAICSLIPVCQWNLCPTVYNSYAMYSNVISVQHKLYLFIPFLNGCFIRLDSAEVSKCLFSPSFWKASQGTSRQVRACAIPVPLESCELFNQTISMQTCQAIQGP